MTAATAQRQARRARERRPDVVVRIELDVGLRFDRTAAAREARIAVRDALRVYLAARMNGADVEATGSAVVVTAGYHGHALNAGALTAAAWAAQCLDEAIPDDSPLAAILAEGGIRITTTERTP